MSSSYVSISEFVNKAIEFEIESAEFYRDLAAKVSEPKSAEALREFEVQERAHASTLRSYSLPEDSGARLQFGPSLTLSMPPTPEDTGVESLFTLAIERERKSAKLYDYASDLAVGDFKQVLISLADFERGHEEDLKVLRANLAQIKKPEAPDF